MGVSFSASGDLRGNPPNDRPNDPSNNEWLDDSENEYWAEFVHLTANKKVHALRQECQAKFHHVDDNVGEMDEKI